VIDENKNTITIKELPLKFWTNDYKEFLENLIYETDSLFKNYVNLSSDISVNFILKYDVENKETILKMHMEKDSDNLNVLYKYLKLYKTIKQSNMNLYTTDYKIKTYKNAEEIIEDFYNNRLGFYTKRKDLMLQKLKEQLKLYGNMIKFTELVIDMKGKIFSMDNDSINKHLKDNKIDMLDNSYDYLLNMTFKQLTKANVEKLETKVKELKAEYKMIESKDMKTLWLEDLEKLQEIIN
jgi:DNA topoisomerase-2